MQKKIINPKNILVQSSAFRGKWNILLHPQFDDGGEIQPRELMRHWINNLLTFNPQAFKRKNKGMSNMLRKWLFTLTVSIKFSQSSLSVWSGRKESKGGTKKTISAPLTWKECHLTRNLQNKLCFYGSCSNIWQQLNRNKRFKLCCDHFRFRYFPIDPEYYSIYLSL